ncbi:MAG: hypothetical protein GY814_18585 [Gammaproteobacteria bacterium]|nr:hypothetical protein [Gammaproteobacteria bacterium]
MFKEFQNLNNSLFSVPVQKIIDLNIATFNAVVKTQQAESESLLSLAEERSKAALKISDLDGFIAFLKEQGEITQTNAQKFIDGNNVAVKDAQAYISEVQAIMSDSQAAVKKSVENLAVAPAPAKKSAAKKAA